MKAECCGDMILPHVVANE